MRREGKGTISIEREVFRRGAGDFRRQCSLSENHAGDATALVIAALNTLGLAGRVGGLDNALGDGGGSAARSRSRGGHCRELCVS